MTGLYIGMTFGGLLMLIFIGILIYFWFKNRSVKRLTRKLGQSAEVIINKDIATWAKHTKNKFIKASLYSYGRNMVFEVDGILVTDKGLIVTEIKSIKGEIHGDAKNSQWIKQMGQKQHATGNPIIQNDKHIKHIMDMTGIKVPIVSLIVYSNRAESIKITNQPEHVVLTRHSELFNSLDKINSILERKLSEHQVKKLYNEIKSFKTNSSKDIKLHKEITGQNRR
ncbi:nuclease-related domain-containing protein [Mycoplasma marinum]|uniref:NERD domain-containing protein n=1 Tax=Mycoplasma marinum TaxID=1937190 RepID=A0A4R0XQY7_9MOLU|nr:nuclease-related domain-containing protein [Mycoplasma marinum]TCG10790.1 hypothetical protein C4B24_03905 [Mycoplasma marinum]